MITSTVHADNYVPIVATQQTASALDAVFHVAQQLDQNRKAEGTTSKASIKMRLLLEQEQRAADVHCVYSREKQVEFWEELLKSKPSTRKMHELAHEFAVNMALAEDRYRRALEMCPTSAATHKRHSRFLQEVCHMVSLRC